MIFQITLFKSTEDGDKSLRPVPRSGEPLFFLSVSQDTTSWLFVDASQLFEGFLIVAESSGMEGDSKLNNIEA